MLREYYLPDIMQKADDETVIWGIKFGLFSQIPACHGNTNRVLPEICDFKPA